MTLLHIATRTGILLGFWGIVLWIVVYTIMGPWWKHPFGRTYVINSLLLAGVLGIMGIFQFFPWLAHSPALLWALALLLLAIGPVLIWRSWLYYHTDTRAFWNRVSDFELTLANPGTRKHSLRKKPSLPADDLSSRSPDPVPGPDPAPHETEGQSAADS